MHPGLRAHAARAKAGPKRTGGGILALDLTYNYNLLMLVALIIMQSHLNASIEVHKRDETSWNHECPPRRMSGILDLEPVHGDPHGSPRHGVGEPPWVNTLLTSPNQGAITHG